MTRKFPYLFLVLYFVFVKGMMLVDAHTNGNIDVKHGTAHPIGSYYYDSSRPHAVTDIENPLGAVDLPSDYVSVSYNELGKAATVTDGGNPYITYHYGPDHERWRGVQHQGGSTWSNLYFGDYEERYVNANSRRSFVYLDGGVLAVSDNGGSYQFYYIHTDHQGSIIAITDAQGSYVFKATYDAWGRQAVTQNTLAFQRGYTGHEMMREGGLINMNGRIYDSALSLFLSPDNYVQEPFNSQNFNRYSYCLNNPLKYVDPSGEIPILVIAAALVVSGGINVAINSNEIHSWQHALASFGVGALMGGISLYGSPFLGSLVAGAGNSVVNQGFNHGWQHIDMGNVALSMGLNTLVYSTGSMFNKWLEKPIGKATDWIKNEIAKTTVQDAIGSGIGGFTIGTGLSLFNGENIGEALKFGGRQALQGAVFGGLSGLTRGYAEKKLNTVYYEKHHFATNKNKKYTPEMKELASHYGLDLNDAWNVELLPHKGRHPNEYHDWIFEPYERNRNDTRNESRTFYTRV